MKNAHERFGQAEFEKKSKDTRTLVRLPVDCFIAEPSESHQRTEGHLLSTFGSDVEVGALWAAIVSEEPIRVFGPDLPPQTACFGAKPGIHRGTLRVSGRKRPLRHLVVVSAELKCQGDSERIILKDDSPELVLHAAASFHGLPLLPEWSAWFHQRLQRANRIRPLTGLNVNPIAITATKQELLEWIGEALKHGEIQIPTA